MFGTLMDIWFSLSFSEIQRKLQQPNYAPTINMFLSLTDSRSISAYHSDIKCMEGKSIFISIAIRDTFIEPNRMLK